MNVRRASLALTAMVLLLGALAIGQEAGGFAQWVHVTMAVSVIGGGLILLTAWLWRRETIDRRWLLLVVILGVLMRLLVLPADRELSDDAARYHWDGKAMAHGVNPYLFSPDDPAVKHLWTDPVDERINHPWYRTCYPPVAEGLFTVAYWLSPGRLLGLQLLNLLAEILTWFILARELAQRRRSLAWLLLIIWSPLLILQGYLPGHLDLLALPFVALLVRAVARRQAGWAGVWLTLACLVKPLPLLFLPAIARELGWRRTRRLLLVCGAVGLVAYAPFLRAGWYLFSSTWLMATDWSFNGSVGAALEQLLPMRQAHLVSGVLTGAGVLLTTWRGRDFLARALGGFTVFVVFTPTLFPWYLITALPLLVLGPQPALLVLGVLAPLSDLVVVGYRLRGVWEQAAWVRWVQYVPFYGVLTWGFRRRGRPRSEAGPADSQSLRQNKTW